MSHEDGYLTAIRPRVGVKQHASDFANTFKAFIGSGYLAIPFAFTKAGIGLGTISMVVAAFMTDHCCQLIIRAKTRVTNRLLNAYEQELREPVTMEHIDEIRKKMEKNITYGSIGKLAFGKWGVVMVNIPLLITQFGFCTAYFIFIATTVEACFPVLHYTNWTHLVTASVNETDYTDLESDFFSHEFPTIAPSNTTVYTKSTAPSLYLLMLTPLPFFIAFAMMRSVRKMGPVSFMANISILAGYFAILIYLLVGISQDGLSKFDWFVFSSFPIFWGQITGAYEGIGTIVAIESSMDGNRHLFPCFLHTVLTGISTMLCGFGIAGYLRYGPEHTEQTINTNLPPFSVFALLVNVTLLIGVLCTYPLQNFPVIRIMEGYVFGDGAIFGPSLDEETRPLIRSPTHSKIMDASSSVDVSSSVANWKRNIFRIFLVLIQFGVALLLKDFFAYFLSFVGAVGSSPLAYILPCVFHLKLRHGELKPIIIIKDIVIIIVGVAGMFAGCYSVISEIVSHYDDSGH